MNTPSEDNSDQELADLMADPAIVDSESLPEGDTTNSVEVGIPPTLQEGNDAIDSNEESFSISDFEEEFQPQPNPTKNEQTGKVDVTEKVASDDNSENNVIDSDSLLKEDSLPSTSNHKEGDVAQFRQTLASLSRQLELDRLTFLHKALEEQGGGVPSLDDIASDITGEKLNKPLGDFDHYGNRPSARLEGWVSGLSFGIPKRAKKFSK